MSKKANLLVKALERWKKLYPDLPTPVVTMDTRGHSILAASETKCVSGCIVYEKPYLYIGEL